MRCLALALLPSFVFLSSFVHAEESDPLARRLLLPNLIGYGFRATSAGSSGVLTGLDGLVSYANGTADAGTGVTSSHVESFALAPAFDVRLGRFTVGGAFLFAQTTSTYDSPMLQGTLTNVRVGIEPRVGVLIPIVRGLTLWPTAKLDVSVGSARAVVAGARVPADAMTQLAMMGDLTFVIAVGARFFVTVGPSAGWVTTFTTHGAQSTRETTFRLGAGLGVGLAF